MIRQIDMAMNEDQNKLRELDIKHVGTVLFIKANLLVQTFMCHDKYNFATDITKYKINIMRNKKKSLNTRERSKKRRKKIHMLVNRTGIV
jgi:hypothetical protein